LRFESSPTQSTLEDNLPAEGEITVGGRASWDSDNFLFRETFSLRILVAFRVDIRLESIVEDAALVVVEFIASSQDRGAI
jgi:hypothetical protein